MSKLKDIVRQVKTVQESYSVDHANKIQQLLERVDTTLNASITELFPAIAFNLKYKPSSVEDFKKFLYKLNINKAKKSFHSKDAAAAKLVIDKLSSMDERFVKTKMENAIGITNYLYNLHSSKPIKNVVWGYRAKPTGIPKNHAGDIFVFFKDGDKIGVSLKAGTKKSKEPLKNTYVGTQYKNLGIDTTPLQNDLWNRVYSKVPGVKDVASKSDFVRNKKVTQLYVDYYVENESEANELYKEMLVVCRQHMCKVINNLNTEEFIDWVQNTFNLQRKGEEVPLVMVKAVGNTAEQKGDDIVDLIPLVNKHHAYLNKNSVQEYLIDIFTPDDKKTLKMTIRSDSGVRPEKGTSGQGRLGQYLQLKMQYSGTL
tara:strand:- start:239 stop:1348 length:1110 start_codon:yes stop_codon:yes gene_type:complete